MTPEIALAVIVVALAAWATLPFLPTLGYLFGGKREQLLTIDREDAGHSRHFAHAFRRMLRTEIEAILLAHKDLGRVHGGRLKNGERYYLAGGTVATLPGMEARNEGESDVLHLTAGSVHTLPAFRFLGEMFCGGDLTGGTGTTYRAIYVEGNANLGRASIVLRWVHAHGVLKAAPATRLHGRATADQAIEIQPEGLFQRLAAPVIAFGCEARYDTMPVSSAAGSAIPALPGDRGRMVVEGDLALGEYTSLLSDIVVGGKLVVGRKAMILGSIRAERGIALAQGCIVGGSLVSPGPISIGRGGFVGGPVIGEEDVVIEEDSSIGTHAHPTSLSAPRIEVRAGTRVHGTVSAREHGFCRHRRAIAALAGAVAVGFLGILTQPARADDVHVETGASVYNYSGPYGHRLDLTARGEWQATPDLRVSADALRGRFTGQSGGQGGLGLQYDLSQSVFTRLGYARGDGASFLIRNRADAELGRKWSESGWIASLRSTYIDYTSGTNEKLGGVSLVKYFAQPAPYLLVGQVDLGGGEVDPGGRRTYDGLAALSWGENENFMLVGRVQWSHVAYDAVVGQTTRYNETAVGMTAMKWITNRWGLSLAVDYGMNRLYNRKQATLGAFASF